MSRHEIRLRRQKLTGHGAERFRNYESVLRRHGEERKLKRITRVFTLLMVLLFIIIILAIVVRFERKLHQPSRPATEQPTSTG